VLAVERPTRRRRATARQTPICAHRRQTLRSRARCSASAGAIGDMTHCEVWSFGMSRRRTVKVLLALVPMFGAGAALAGSTDSTPASERALEDSCRSYQRRPPAPRPRYARKHYAAATSSGTGPDPAFDDVANGGALRHGTARTQHAAAPPILDEQRSPHPGTDPAQLRCVRRARAARGRLATKPLQFTPLLCR
jgi:hypothetical protein